MLNNGGDTVQLLHPDGNVEDTTNYSSSALDTSHNRAPNATWYETSALSPGALNLPAPDPPDAHGYTDQDGRADAHGYADQDGRADAHGYADQDRGTYANIDADQDDRTHANIDADQDDRTHANIDADAHFYADQDGHANSDVDSQHERLRQP